jgi:peptide/nickel transport system substrate-binding protein
MFPKRLFTVLAVVATITLLSFACGGEKKESATNAASTATSGQATQSSSAVTRQNTLVIATAEDLSSLDPPVGGNDLSSEIDWQMYEMAINYTFAKKDNTLVQQGDKTEPWLAEKVDVSTDGTVITFKMRKGVKFYPTGTEMSAKDLDWIIRRELEMPIGFGKPTMVAASISKPGRVVDDYTYELTLDRPNVAALAVLALIDTPLIDSVEAQKHATADDPWANKYLHRNSLGTGPYYLASYTPGQQVVLEAVPNYWRTPPYFKRIVYRIVPDPAVRLTLLRSGEVDIAQKLTAQELKTIEGAKGIAIREALEPRIHLLWMNTLTGPTADLNVRKAIAAAVPYKDILNSAFLGAGTLHDSFFMPEALGYLKAPPDLYAQDLNRAKSYLAQSQYPSGFKSDLMIDSVRPEHETAALLIQQALKPLNIEINIVKLPTVQFRTDGNAKKLPMAVHTTINWINEGAYIIPIRYLKSAVANWSGYNIPEAEEIYLSTFTTNESVRKAAYERMQKLWNDQVPYAILLRTNLRVAIAQNIQNYVFAATSTPQYFLMSRSQ